MTDLSAMTAEQVYEALSPEQKFGVARICSTSRIYGPWTAEPQFERFVRPLADRAREWPSTSVRCAMITHGGAGWCDKPGWYWWATDEAGTMHHNAAGEPCPDRESAMRAVDAVLLAAGAVLVSPEDLESVKEVQGG